MGKRKRVDRHSHTTLEPSPKNARTHSEAGDTRPRGSGQTSSPNPNVKNTPSDAELAALKAERSRKKKEKKARKLQLRTVGLRDRDRQVDSPPQSKAAQALSQNPGNSGQGKSSTAAHSENHPVLPQASTSLPSATNTSENGPQARDAGTQLAGESNEIQKVSSKKKRRREGHVKGDGGGVQLQPKKGTQTPHTQAPEAKLNGTSQETATLRQSSGARDQKMQPELQKSKNQQTVKTRKASAQNHKDTVADRVGEQQAYESSRATQADESFRETRDDEDEANAPSRNHQTWTVSKPNGGRMQAIDPLFSFDEQYLLVAHQTFVRVYATSTSLLVRELEIQPGPQVIAIAFSTHDPEEVYIGTTNGGIWIYQWRTAKLLYRMKAENHTELLAHTTYRDGRDVLLTTHVHQKSNWRLTARVKQGSDPANTSTHYLFDHNHQISSLFVLNDGATILMTSEDQIILGSQVHFESLPQKLYYSWRIFTCPEWIQSISVREHPRAIDARQQSRPQIDVALGGLKGSICVYNDIVDGLCQKQLPSDQIRSHQLHWHRNAVLSLKWSQDGNYLVSGGEETVLVMWQVETGRKEFLPHLGAPVENLVVSPTGSSYAVCLADNSAMILSTAEMKPSFSIAGIQLSQPSKKYAAGRLTADRIAKASSRYTVDVCAATTCHSKPGQLLLAVPSYSSPRATSLASQNRSYLQTIDVDSGQQISKQALVRTNITNKNIAPDAFTLEEPNVTHICTSNNGEWLATVEEWIPPKSDRADRAVSADGEEYQQDIYREHYLKLWSWNPSEGIWKLNTRIDKPHAYEGGQRPAKILALLPNPSSTGIASFGEDGSLKFWKPSMRLRGGLEVKDNAGSNYSNWHLRSSLRVGLPPTSSTYDAKLAWSDDGSVIALGIQEKCSSIYLIDAAEAKIEKTYTGLYSDSLLALGNIDRYLVILADQLILWDLVSESPHWSSKIDIPRPYTQEHVKNCHLAINSRNRSFAVSLPKTQSKKLVGAQITIYGVEHEKPLHTEHFHQSIVKLLPAPDQYGYYLIDATAEVRTVTPGRPFHVALEQSSFMDEESSTGISKIFGKTTLQNTMDFIKEPDPDAEVPRVTREKLAEAVDPHPGQPLPSVEEMFQRVVDLYLPVRSDVSG